MLWDMVAEGQQPGRRWLRPRVSESFPELRFKGECERQTAERKGGGQDEKAFQGEGTACGKAWGPSSGKCLRNGLWLRLERGLGGGTQRTEAPEALRSVPAGDIFFSQFCQPSRTKGIFFP